MNCFPHNVTLVRQRDKETAAALRLSSGGSTTQCSEIPLAMLHALSSDNNDVFEDDNAVTEGRWTPQLEQNHFDCFQRCVDGNENVIWR